MGEGVWITTTRVSEMVQARSSTLFLSFFRSLGTYRNNGLGGVFRIRVITRDDVGATVGGLASVAVLLFIAATNAEGIGVGLDQVDVVVVVGARGTFLVFKRMGGDTIEMSIKKNELQQGSTKSR